MWIVCAEGMLEFSCPGQRDSQGRPTLAHPVSILLADSTLELLWNAKRSSLRVMGMAGLRGFVTCRLDFSPCLQQHHTVPISGSAARQGVLRNRPIRVVSKRARGPGDRVEAASSRRKMEGRDVLADAVVLVKMMLMHAIGTYMRSCAENKYGSGLSGVTL